MSGRRTFSDLAKEFTPERRRRVEARKTALRAAMPLHELRRARAMTQKALGETLRVNQPAIAKIERRTDMYVSNLRSYIEAMGGRLKIVASFPEGDVAITNFSEAGDLFDADVAAIAAAEAPAEAVAFDNEMEGEDA
jgi:DNA-binding XRE family transcriptional regulator